MPIRALELASRQQDLHRRRFQQRDYPLQEAMFLAERRISLFWIRAWANKDVNVVTIVAWAGVGKSTLNNVVQILRPFIVSKLLFPTTFGCRL
jgi:hypothetical protein